MKKRKIAWILAMAMTATSIDSTALMAGATELATTEQEGPVSYTHLTLPTT